MYQYNAITLQNKTMTTSGMKYIEMRKYILPENLEFLNGLILIDQFACVYNGTIDVYPCDHMSSGYHKFTLTFDCGLLISKTKTECHPDYLS